MLIRLFCPLFCSLFLSLALGAALVAEVIQFKVQPYKGLKIMLDGKVVKPLFARRVEKTLGRVRIKVDGQKTLQLEAPGFQHSSLPITKDLKGSLIVLNRATSVHTYVKAFKTGKQPKSVTFIDNDRVIIPLLDDKNGIELRNLRTGELKFLNVPRKYKNQVGFVETLIRKKQNELWVSQMTTASVHVFSLDKLQYQFSIKTRGSWSKVMLENEKTRHVYLTNWVSKDISVIDVSNKPYKEVRRVRMKPASPRGLALSKDGRRVYVAEFKQEGHKNTRGYIRLVDANTFKTLKRFGPAGRKRHIVSIGESERDLLFVSDMLKSRVEVYNMKTNQLIKTMKTYYRPNTIVLSPDHNRLYVSSRGPNNPKTYLMKGPRFGKVHVFDTTTFKEIDVWEGGNQPTGLDVSPDGCTVVSSDFLDRRIRVYRYNDLKWANSNMKCKK